MANDNIKGVPEGLTEEAIPSETAIKGVPDGLTEETLPNQVRKEVKASLPSAEKPKEPGILSTAENFYRSLYKPVSEKVDANLATTAADVSSDSGIIRKQVIAPAKTLGRGLKAGTEAALGLIPGAYHAFTDEATPEEKQKYADFEKEHGEAPGTETSGVKRLGLGIQRIVGADQATEAAKTWADPTKRPTYEQTLSVLPEALGQGAGTVVAAETLGKGANDFSSRPVSETLPATTSAVRAAQRGTAKAIGYALDNPEVTGTVAGALSHMGFSGVYIGSKLGRVFDKLGVDSSAVEGWRQAGFSEAQANYNILERVRKQAAKDLGKVQTKVDNYKASQDAGLPIPEDLQKRYDEAVATHDEALAHAEVAEHRMEAEKADHEASKNLTPEQRKAATRPITSEDVDAVRKTAATAKTKAESGTPTKEENDTKLREMMNQISPEPLIRNRAPNVKLPGEVQPETIARPTETKPIPSISGDVPLAEGGGVLVRPPKLLTEGTPEVAPKPPTGELIPPEKPVRPGKLSTLKVSEGGRVVETEHPLQVAIEEGLRRGSAEAKPAVRLPESMGGEPLTEPYAKEFRNENASPEDLSVVEDMLKDHTDQDLLREARRQGIDVDKYDLSKREGAGRHRVDRNRLIKDLSAKLPDTDVSTLVELSKKMADPADESIWEKSEKAGMSKSQKARAIAQELDKARGGKANAASGVKGGAPDNPNISDTRESIKKQFARTPGGLNPSEETTNVASQSSAGVPRIKPTAEETQAAQQYLTEQHPTREVGNPSGMPRIDAAGEAQLNTLARAELAKMRRQGYIADPAEALYQIKQRLGLKAGQPKPSAEAEATRGNTRPTQADVDLIRERAGAQYEYAKHPGDTVNVHTVKVSNAAGKDIGGLSAHEDLTQGGTKTWTVQQSGVVATPGSHIGRTAYAKLLAEAQREANRTGESVVVQGDGVQTPQAQATWTALGKESHGTFNVDKSGRPSITVNPYRTSPAPAKIATGGELIDEPLIRSGKRAVTDLIPDLKQTVKGTPKLEAPSGFITKLMDRMGLSEGAQHNLLEEYEGNLAGLRAKLIRMSPEDVAKAKSANPNQPTSPEGSVDVGAAMRELWNRDEGEVGKPGTVGNPLPRKRLAGPRRAPGQLEPGTTIGSGESIGAQTGKGNYSGQTALSQRTDTAPKFTSPHVKLDDEGNFHLEPKSAAIFAEKARAAAEANAKGKLSDAEVRAEFDKEYQKLMDAVKERLTPELRQQYRDKALSIWEQNKVKQAAEEAREPAIKARMKADQAEAEQNKAAQDAKEKAALAQQDAQRAERNKIRAKLGLPPITGVVPKEIVGFDPFKAEKYVPQSEAQTLKDLREENKRLAGYRDELRAAGIDESKRSAAQKKIDESEGKVSKLRSALPKGRR